MPDAMKHNPDMIHADTDRTERTATFACRVCGERLTLKYVAGEFPTTADASDVHTDDLHERGELL